MPRRPTNNVRLMMTIPGEAVEQIDAIQRHFAPLLETRSAAIRAVILRGVQEIQQDLAKEIEL